MEVHERLLAAARQLFGERGVSRTTVDDLSEAADVARQTFFNHFPYKEALAVELAADGIQHVAERAQALLESGVPALDVLERTVFAVLEDSLIQGELAVVVARELLHSDPDRARRAAQQIPIPMIFEAILVQAREEGTVRDDLPLDVVASRISALIRSIICEFMCRSADDLRREVRVCIDIVMNGIGDRSR
jgi:NADH dehydrogenase